MCISGVAVYQSLEVIMVCLKGMANVAKTSQLVLHRCEALQLLVAPIEAIFLLYILRRLDKLNFLQHLPLWWLLLDYKASILISLLSSWYNLYGKEKEGFFIFFPPGPRGGGGGGGICLLLVQTFAIKLVKICEKQE